MDLQSPKAVALLRTFDGALEKLKAELQENLGKIDVLDATQVKHVLELFNQRLIIARHDFLEYLARTIGIAARLGFLVLISDAGRSGVHLSLWRR